MEKEKLTVKKLSNILHEEFERDGWGDLDVQALANPKRQSEASSEDMGGLYEVLERAVKRINENNEK